MMSRYITGQTATRPSICIVTLGAIALAATAIASPVMAFNTERLGQRGSLMLEDIMPLIERSPQLKHEVTEAARKIGKKPNEVICDGMRFSRQWENLSAGRVAPYHCHFADDLWLKIRATVSITSASGKVFDEATREAKKNASRVRETNPNWKWLRSRVGFILADYQGTWTDKNGICRTNMEKSSVRITTIEDNEITYWFYYAWESEEDHAYGGCGVKRGREVGSGKVIVDLECDHPGHTQNDVSLIRIDSDHMKIKAKTFFRPSLLYRCK